MKIITNIKSPQFTASYDPTSIHQITKKVKHLTKAASQITSEPGLATDDLVKEISDSLKQYSEKVGSSLREVKPNIKTKAPSKVYAVIMKAAESVGNLFSKKGGGGKNLAAAVTSVVLWGNVLKEVVGTCLYTVQALTNEDLPKDKRRFVGAYDLGVGVTSTCISFILGVGFQDIIKNMYKRTLKGIKGVNPKYEAILEGLSAFTSFGLQTIVGKRILAPLVGVPVATRLRKWMENREAKKNGTFTGAVPAQPQPEQSSPLEYPTMKQGYVDLQAFVAKVKEQQAKESV